MRKRFSVFVLLILFISCIYSSEYSKEEIQSKLEKTLKVTFIDNLKDDFWGSYDETFYNDLKIIISERYYSDKDTDCDDWYNSKDMFQLHKELLKNKQISYGYGSDIHITHSKELFMLDYVVLAMFDFEDIRFERFFLLFDNEKCIIIKTEEVRNFEKIRAELVKKNYINYLSEDDENYYFWNDNINKTEIVEELRKNKSEIGTLQFFYNESEHVYDILSKYLCSTLYERN